MFDFLQWNGDFFVSRLNRDRVLTFCDDQSGNDSSVRFFNHLHLKIFRNRRARIDQIKQQIIDVGSLRARQIGTNRRPRVE